MLALGHLISIKNQWLKKHIKDFERQRIYYRDKKANVSATNGGPLQCQNFIYLMCKL